VTSPLELAADLERRDAEVAAEIDRVGRLGDAAREIGSRTQAISSLLETAPVERASLDRAEAEARTHLSEADADLASAGAALEDARRRGDLVDAQRSHEHAQTAARDAAARVTRIACTRETLEASEQAARADVPNLVAAANRIAGELAGLSRISSSGRALPESSLGGVAAWAARVHVALLVARSQLDGERDRLVRDANELGSVVLGEQLAGNSVELVGRRVRALLVG
jgi:hypothetical protein